MERAENRNTTTAQRMASHWPTVPKAAGRFSMGEASNSRPMMIRGQHRLSTKAPAQSPFLMHCQAAMNTP